MCLTSVLPAKISRLTYLCKHILKICPVVFVQYAVVDGFPYMGLLYAFASVKVGYGACHFQYAVIGAGRQTVAGDGLFQKGGAFCIQTAVLANHLGGHLGVAVDGGTRKALLLYEPRLYDAFADCLTGFAGLLLVEHLKGNGLYITLYIYSIQQRTTDTSFVALYL